MPVKQLAFLVKKNCRELYIKSLQSLQKLCVRFISSGVEKVGSFKSIISQHTFSTPLPMTPNAPLIIILN
jgi:hypothetical protein